MDYEERQRRLCDMRRGFANKLRAHQKKISEADAVGLGDIFRDALKCDVEGLQNVLDQIDQEMAASH